MSIQVINNISSLVAENAVSNTQTNLQSTLQQLSTGLKINSGADDPAGLSIANGLGANIAALTQSSQNASDGVGLLQTADGALSQVTTILNQAVTIATEASNGGLTASQATALGTEFTSILNEITNIGTETNFNGTAVFGATATTFTGDGTSTGDATTSTAIATLTPVALGITAADATADLSTTSGAAAALLDINTAISNVAAQRGTIGASINQLTADSGVENTEVQNLTSAQNNVQNADIATVTTNLTQFNILEQTGFDALSQSSQAQQNVLKLIQ
jgi:flagellin